MNRRRFLGHSALALALPSLLLSRRARALAPDELRFVFVFASGGWDTTRVFATAFDNPDVDMEALAEPASQGDIAWVEHPDRPRVSAFLRAWADRMVIVNGVQVRAIAHEICTMLALTGGSSGLDPDWATILASEARQGFTLPHLVLGGPSFAGPMVASVARSGSSGQLAGLLSGEILAWNDRYVGRPSAPLESALDRYIDRRVRGRAAARHSPLDQKLAQALAEATEAAQGLKDYQYIMDFAAGSTLGDQARVAVDALRLSLCRSVSLGYAGGGGLGWDSHADNDATQSVLFEQLFTGLGELMALLEATSGPAGGRLLDQTVVVVLSEMGRTPQLNATLGKDHWPYTSMMLLGPGLAHGRVIGGFDEGFAGRPVDLESGELFEGGQLITAEAVGAALLELGGVDPAAWVQGTAPLRGILG